jgi:flagellar basal-body rod protein FlgG
MAAQQTNVDVIANNIANVNTTGFKRQRTDFQDLFYDSRVTPGARTGDASQNPTGVQIGTGVNVAATTRIFTGGSIDPTGRNLDIAIDGDGFFRVSLPDGSEAFTRAGDFRLDVNGTLVTPNGYILQPQIQVPDGATDVTVGETGEVSAVVDGRQTALGTISLSRFSNPSGLNAVGRNLFQVTDASGDPQEGAPGTAGFGIVRQGMLEKANVEIVTELVELIMAQRAYEMNSRTIKTGDQMLQTANELVR